MFFIQLILLFQASVVAHDLGDLCEIRSYKHMSFEVQTSDEEDSAVTLLHFKEELEWNGFLVDQVNFSKRQVVVTVIEENDALAYIEEQKNQRLFLSIQCVEFLRK